MVNIQNRIRLCRQANRSLWGREMTHDFDDCLENRDPARDSDPLTSIIFDHGLFFLGVASHLIDQIPVSDPSPGPRTANPYMWSNGQLLRLKSDIIALSALIDHIDSKNKETLRIRTKKLMLHLDEKETERPLRFFRLSSAASESDECDIIGSREEDVTPQQQEERLKESRRRHTSDRTMSLARNETQTESQQEKIAKQDLIWENTELFMAPVTSLSKFSAFLAPSRPINYPPSILSEPFGKHYSLAIAENQELFKNDMNKANLILPPPPSMDNRQSGVFAQMHTRLMASLISITPQERGEILNEFKNESYDLSKSQDFIMNRKNNDDVKQLRLSRKATPTSTGLGLALYGQLEFDEKLKLELQSLDFTINNSLMVYADCPVNKCIQYQVGRQDEVIANTNRVKERIVKLLNENKNSFEDEIAYKKDWDAALKRFLDSQSLRQSQQSQAQKKKKKD